MIERPLLPCIELRVVTFDFSLIGLCIGALRRLQLLYSRVNLV